MFYWKFGEKNYGINMDCLVINTMDVDSEFVLLMLYLEKDWKIVQKLY